MVYRPDITTPTIECQQCAYLENDRWNWIGTILASGSIQIQISSIFKYIEDNAIYEGKGTFIGSSPLQDRKVIPSGEQKIIILPADIRL